MRKYSEEWKRNKTNDLLDLVLKVFKSVLQEMYFQKLSPISPHI